MMKEPTLLVLAAGMGSRYGGLKQLESMGPSGETVLDYSVHDAIYAGFKRVVFVIREEFAGDFVAVVGNRFMDRIDVSYVHQSLEDLPPGHGVPEGRSKPWGTAHAVLAARHAVNGPFAVVNADDFYGRDAYVQAVSFFNGLSDGDSGSSALVGYPLNGTLSDHGLVNRGICQQDETGHLVAIEEYVNIGRDENGMIHGSALDGSRPELSGDTLVSMNFWAFGHSFFGQLDDAFTRFLEESGDDILTECYLPTVVDQLIKKGRLRSKVFTTTGTWFGVTYPEDKAYCVKAIERLTNIGEYPV